MKNYFGNKHISSFQIISLGFLSVIFVGTILLMLPFAAREAGNTSFLDALFTATSAVCVTGLIVHDTATYWSEFGQAVLLILIQIGGLGIVTIGLMIMKISGRKIGLMQRSTMQDAISAPKISGIVKMTGFIFRNVVIIELLGTVVLSTVFCREYGIGKGLWYSLFHSVSAFCNAGFDLNGTKEPFSSLMSYVGHPIVNATIMLLIIIGGIGFFTWEDIKTNKWNVKRYRMQSKVVLLVTIILIVFPTIYFYFGEFAERSFEERIWSSLFQAVTPRTAGFNTVDLTAISEVGIMILIILMLVGGSPGSTAGGMKTTTVAVLFSTLFSVFKRRKEAHFFERRISNEVIKNAAAIFMMYLTLFLGGGMVISYIETIPLLTALFETASAIGTVGLSLGITSDLSMVSKMILISLMFLGRVGGLTLIFAAFSDKHANVSKYPEEKITVG